MYISKLKYEEQERPVECTEAYAKNIKKDEASKFINEIKNIMKIPSHLKRVKFFSSDAVTVLLKLEDGNLINSEAFKVMVPKHPAVTAEQFNVSKEIWPCYFFPYKETNIIDMRYIKVNYEKIKNRFIENEKRYCSELCMIVNPITEEVLDVSFDTDNILGHSVLKSVEAVSKSGVGYLCTGMDAFVVNEPCISCAMAFVHSRIGRVFYINESKEGSFSNLKICYNKKLNHRYEVYKIE